MKVSKYFVSLAAVFCITLLLPPTAAAKNLKVITTLTDLASLTQEVGGDKVDVEALAKGYQDPHYVDPKPSFLLKLRHADLLISVGLELEIGWLPPLITQSGNGNIQPAAADDGTALGAALYRSALSKEVINKRLAVPFFGPSYSEGEIHAALKEFGDRVEANTFEKLDETCREAAKLIADGKVIAWFRGRMEFGPRALGHRSILAEPGDPDMRDRINAMVKMREAFRPFAPAVSLEQVSRWFDVPPMTELPYMIMIVNVRKEYRATLPAITHVDGSARVQTVSARDNEDFHTLLRAVGEITGREMVLNTSFNVKGQPIVNTPQEAIETFLRTGIEYLFLENTLVKRRP